MEICFDKEKEKGNYIFRTSCYEEIPLVRYCIRKGEEIIGVCFDNDPKNLETFIRSARKNQSWKLAFPCEIGEDTREETFIEDVIRINDLKIEKSPEEIITVNADYIRCPNCKLFSPEVNHLSIKRDSKNKAKEMEAVYGEKWRTIINAYSSRGKVNRPYKKVHIHPLDNLEGIDENATDLDIFSTRYKCPFCGTKIKHTEGNKKNTTFFVDNNSMWFNSILKRTQIINKKDENKIVFKGYYTGFGVNKHTMKMFTKLYSCAMVFNTKTGQTYLLPIIDENGKHPKDTPKHVINTTFYGACKKGYLDLFHDYEAVLTVFNLICEQANIPEQQVMEYKSIIEELNRSQIGYSRWNTLSRFLCLVNRFNNLPAESISKILYRENFPSYAGIFTGVKNTDSVAEIMNKAIKNCKVKNCKTSKKIVARDITNLLYFKLFHKLGFSDINILSDFIFESVFWAVFYNEEHLNNSQRFLQEIKKYRKTDAEIFKTIKCKRSSYFPDAIRIYNELLEENPESITKEMFKGNIIDIHDRLSNELNKIRNKNVPLRYENKFLKYNRTYPLVTFSLAKDTYELIEVGEIMHICVGTYRESAKKGNCIIVIGRNPENKPIVCIEISPTEELIQVKGYCNAYLKDEEANAVRQWVQDTGINGNKCFDYKNMT